jgi:hypothetical protein
MLEGQKETKIRSRNEETKARILAREKERKWVKKYKDILQNTEKR